MKKAILGIDLSLSNTGLALLLGDKIKSETVSTSPKETWVDRVRKIEAKIIEYAAEADEIYIENYSFNSKFGREILAEVGGIIRKLLIERFGKEPKKISPTQAKLFATGRGKAPACPKGEVKSRWTKKWLMEEVKKNFNVAFNTDHETDAFVVATIGRTLQMVSDGYLDIDSLPNHQKKIIKSLWEEEKNGKDHIKGGSVKQSLKRRRGNCKEYSGE